MRLADTAGQKSRIYGYLWDRNDESTSPGGNAGKLRHDFLLEIPRKDQDVIRPGIPESIRLEYRNVRSGQELAVFVWAAIHREIDEIGSDPGVIEQCVPLARCAIADDTFPCPLRFDQKFEQLPFGLSDSRFKVLVVCKRRYAGRIFARA